MQLVLIHGVGGASPTKSWTEPLNGRLVQLGYPTIDDGVDEIYVPSYGHLFDTIEAPEVKDTYRAASDKIRFQQRIEYAVRQKQLERAVRPYNERTDVWGWQDVSMALADPFAGLSEFFHFEDVRRFVDKSVVRNAIWRHVLSEMPKSGRVVIVAHSLGSVVAAGLLRRLPQSVTVDLFITIGSPLPFPRYRRPCSPVFTEFPYGRVLSWLNVYSPWDGITGGRGVTGAIDPAVDVCAHINGDHALEAYMSSATVAAAVGSVFEVESQTEPAARTAPARRLHDSWRPLLVGTAFTWQLSNSLPSDEWRSRLRLEAAREESARRAVNDIDAERIRRAESIEHMRGRGVKFDQIELEDHPLADGRYPTFRDLTIGAAELLHGTWQDAQLLSLAVGLMIQPLVAPFDIEASLQRRCEALELTLNVLRRRRGNLADRTFAEQVRKSVSWAQDRLADSKGFPWGTVLIGSGLVLLAATGVGLVVAAPAGLAGAAVVTSTLAAFGPGGMVGGLLTLAALTGTVGGLGTLGVAVELDESGMQDAKAAAAAESGTELARADESTLTATLLGMLSVVHAQSPLSFESTEPVVRIVLNNALDTVRAEHETHREVAPGTSGTKLWRRKVTLLERALVALDSLTRELPQVVGLIAAREAIKSGKPPKNLPPPRSSGAIDGA